MSDLIAIIYPSEAKAEEVRQRLFKLQKEYLITISDAVIAVKTEAGPVKLNQLVNTRRWAPSPAASGAFSSELSFSIPSLVLPWARHPERSAARFRITGSMTPS